MSERVVFVPGLPAPQGSKRLVNGRMIESSKRLPQWRNAVTATIAEADWEPILHGPVTLRLRFVFPRPKYHFRTGKFAAVLRDAAPLWHDRTPDASKVQRAVEDALVDAGVIRDDCQIASWAGSKQYGPKPGVWIELEEIDA